jgi:hypothetical protein
MERLRMVKVLDPIIEKFCVRKYLMESVAVRIPTRAMIPKAIIRMVRIVRNRWLLIESSETLTFSSTRVLFIGHWINS